MLKISILVILCLANCIGENVKPNAQKTTEQNDSCKTNCSLLSPSKCKFKCGARSALICTDTGLERLAGAELGKWNNSLKQCGIELFSLQLDSNSIGRLTQLPNISGLVILNLKRNQMTEIEPKSFLYLTTLKELDLSENFLTGEAVRPDIFIGPSNKEQYEPLSIEVLHLNRNKFHFLDSKTFEHLPSLRELYLHDNPLTVVDEHTVTAITSAQQLLVVSLSGCMLREVSLPKEAKLKRLFLNNNNISTIPQELPANLTYLNVNGNPIAEIPGGSFSHVSNLEELSISGLPELTSIGPEAFRGLRFLQTLHCDYNSKLEEIHPAAFVGMTQNNWTLREVSLGSCSLKILPRSLLPWNEIATLDLRGNPLTCDADDWSSDAIKLLRRSEETFGLLEQQESCNSWHLDASQHRFGLGTISRTLLIAASVVVTIAFAVVLLVLTIRRAQAERYGSPNLMVHYRRATGSSNYSEKL